MKKQNLILRFQEYLGSNFEPGDFIPGELELAGKFRVSRGDIREILQHFGQLGLLERVKKRGTRIRSLPAGELDRTVAFCLRMGGFGFEDIREARLILETALVPYIIQRMTPDMLEALQANLDRQKESLSDIPRFEELDREFHALLFETSHNKTVRLFSNILSIAFRKKYRTRFMSEEWTGIGYKNHCLILDAIRRQDKRVLLKLIREHIIPT
ncbi:MAG: HTH-type transcriptional regulator LutR [Lentisphaerae bacterium ADurb.Bin242]|nr:MAG: HTH-type transcriptional regulator LutR [Lentisphaerae bacterium ADurb.Bin242]